MRNLQLKIVLGILAFGAIIFLVPGCYKDVSIISDTGDEISRTVTFSGDIIPIFNKDCNSSGCHNAGGKSPDLTAIKAFSALQNGGYINQATPENSELFMWMTGKRGAPMPTTGINKDYNALVLAWIKQGALNN